MDIHAIKCFLVVCEAQSLTRAAEQLYVSKQTLSMLIKRMEQELDASLFIRKPAHMELTEEGTLFRKYAQMIMNNWNEYTAASKARLNTEQSVIRIGVGKMSSLLITEDFRKAFSAQYPELHLEIKSAPVVQLMAEMEQGELDMVITVRIPDKAGKYRADLLLDMTPCFVLSEKDPLAERSELTPQDLNGRLLLFSSSVKEGLEELRKDLCEMDIHVDADFLDDSFLTQLKAIQERNGLLLMHDIIQYAIPQFSGYTVRYFSRESLSSLSTMPIYAWRIKTDSMHAGTGAFIEHLRQYLCAAQSGDKMQAR